MMRHPGVMMGENESTIRPTREEEGNGLGFPSDKNDFVQRKKLMIAFRARRQELADSIRSILQSFPKFCFEFRARIHAVRPGFKFHVL